MLLLYTAAVVDIELLLPVAATSCCKSVLCIYLEYLLAIVYLKIIIKAVVHLKYLHLLNTSSC